MESGTTRDKDYFKLWNDDNAFSVSSAWFLKLHHNKIHTKGLQNEHIWPTSYHTTGTILFESYMNIRCKLKDEMQPKEIVGLQQTAAHSWLW